MFALRYKNQYLDLEPGSNPVIEWVSTLFNDSDELLGSFSYPITLQNTPKNNTLLDQSNELAARLSRKDIDVYVELFGMPWKRCVFTYDIDRGKRSGSLKIDNGEFASILKEIELPQVFIKGLGSLNSLDVIPMGFSTDEAIAKMKESTQSIGVMPYVFFPFENRNIFGSYSGNDDDKSYTEPEIINPWNASGFFKGTQEADIKKTWYCPCFYLTWTIKKVCEFLGYEATGDFFESDFIRSLVIDNNSIYNQADVLAPGGFFLRPTNHLPKIKLTDFFKKLRNTFKLVYYFNSDNKTASFVFADTILTSPKRIPLDGFVAKSFSLRSQDTTGFELVQGIDSADDYFKNYPYTKSFTIGEGKVKKKVDVPIGTTFMKKRKNDYSFGSPTFRIPAKKQVGNAFGAKAAGSDAYNPDGYGRNDFDLRLLSYQGQKQDSFGNFYPFATSDGLDSDGTTQITNSMWLGGSNGILSKYHKSWYVFFLRTESVDLAAYFPNIKLNELSPLQKVRWATEEGVHLEAMISKIQFSIQPNSRLLQSKMTVYPIYNQTAAEAADFADFSTGEQLNQGQTFLKIFFENIDEKKLGGNGRWTKYADVIIRAYSDAAGTQPKNVDSLDVSIKKSLDSGGGRVSDTIINISLTGSSVMLDAGHTELIYIDPFFNDRYRKTTFSLMDSDLYTVLL